MTRMFCILSLYLKVLFTSLPFFMHACIDELSVFAVVYKHVTHLVDGVEPYIALCDV